MTDVLDVPESDAGDDVVGSDAADAPVDAGPTCSTTPLTQMESLVNNTFAPESHGFFFFDLSSVGMTGFVQSTNPRMPSAANTLPSFGDCTLWDATVPRLPATNSGTISFTQGTSVATRVFDTAMMRYTSVGFAAFSLMQGAPLAIDVAGNGSVPAGMLSLLFPNVTPGAYFSSPEITSGEISRARDMVLTWTSLPEESDMIMSFQMYDPASVVPVLMQCAVRACANRLVVPAAAIDRQFQTTTGFSGRVQFQAGFYRVAPIDPASANRFGWIGWAKPFQADLID
jgi:hypothetical protein